MTSDIIDRFGQLAFQTSAMWDGFDHLRWERLSRHEQLRWAQIAKAITQEIARMQPVPVVIGDKPMLMFPATTAPSSTSGDEKSVRDQNDLKSRRDG